MQTGIPVFRRRFMTSAPLPLGSASPPEVIEQNFTLAVEHFLNFNISAGDCVANNDKVRNRREMSGIKLGVIRDAKGFQQGGGGRIDAGIGASHAVATFTEHSGERGHR